MPENIIKLVGNIASVLAVLGVVFTAGVTYSNFKKLEDEFHTLKSKNESYERALESHLGSDWVSNIDMKTSHPTKISKNSEKIAISDNWISSIREWSKQQDLLIRKDKLDRFRAIAVYSKKSSLSTFNVKINKHHVKGKNYQIGDEVLIENPEPPTNSFRVKVIGFSNDIENSDVLVQINYSLLKELGLSTRGGRYELYVTNDEQVLRWKSLGEVYKCITSACTKD